jgi:hypothetical protein
MNSFFFFFLKKKFLKYCGKYVLIIKKIDFFGQRRQKKVNKIKNY